MKGQGTLVALAVAAVLVGALLLKGVAREPPSDPTASMDNGAPAGWLALRLLLEERGVSLVQRRAGDEPWPDGPALLVAPPPEAAGWRDAEAAAVLARVREGRLALLLVCDEEPLRNQRASRLFHLVGVSCAPTGKPGSSARGTLPAYAHALSVQGTGRVTAAGDTLAVPAWVDDEGAAVVLRRRVGDGVVTVLSSATVLANDGLARAENAAFFLSLVPRTGPVLFDESHHKVRGIEVLQRAFDTTGPKVASVALLLLVPFVLLGFAPRRGDPPPAEGEPEPFAARAQARALAALYRKAGVRPARDDALDPTPPARRRSTP